MARQMLAVEQIEVVYHDVMTAVQGVSLKVDEGQAVGLIGSNGAGKTTTLRAISGFIGLDRARVSSGRILFDGAEVQNEPPHLAVARGIALVPEREKVFELLSVRENLVIGAATRNAAEKRTALDRVLQGFPALGALLDRQAGYLSGGERQMLAIGAALMMRPRLLLIDELSLGLAPVVVETLVATLMEVRRAFGVALLVVEQSAAVALDMVDHAYVMENGRVVLDGTPERLRAHPDLQEFYLGNVARGDRRSYRDVKQYRRSRRWYG